MDAHYDFEKSQNQAPPCAYQLAPEVSQDVKDNFTTTRFWLALAILAETEDQYSQAVQNSSMLVFSEEPRNLRDGLGDKIKQRLVDPDYLQRQIQDARSSQLGSFEDLCLHYNRRVLNEHNYSLLVDGQSLFPEHLLYKAIDLMPCLEEHKALKWWSDYFAVEREELSHLLEEQYLD